MSYRDPPVRTVLWEHRYVKIDSGEEKVNEHLAEMSADGWELVSAIPVENDKYWCASFRLFWKRLLP